MSDELKPQEGAHDWRCDCECCWLGVTTGTAPKRRSIWQRLRAIFTPKGNPDE